MSKSKIVVEAEKYVTQLLLEKLNSNITYHNLKHTQSVRNAGMQIASLSNLGEAEREIVELACLFHDTGITEVYQDHEKISAWIALEFLQSQ
jgi:HD superfamily phosphodiesterase